MIRRSLAFVLLCVAAACTDDQAAAICSDENVIDDIDDGTGAAASEAVESEADGAPDLAY